MSNFAEIENSYNKLNKENFNNMELNDMIQLYQNAFNSLNASIRHVQFFKKKMDLLQQDISSMADIEYVESSDEEQVQSIQKKKNISQPRPSHQSLQKNELLEPEEDDVEIEDNQNENEKVKPQVKPQIKTKATVKKSSKNQSLSSTWYINIFAISSIE
jgi:hypothetical protein